MNVTATTTWHEANQRYLMAALAVVREALATHVGNENDQSETNSRASLESDSARQTLEQAAADLPAPSALETLCATFGLSSFERDMLLLCAGMELDSTMAVRCATAQGDPRRTYPTFSLAMAAFPEAHWSALTPAAPLRRWRLIDVGTGGSLTTSPLRIDERIIHYLTGVSYLDDRLRGFIEPLQAPAELPPSHRAIASQIAKLWSTQKRSSGVKLVIQLCGIESATKRAIAASACAALGLRLHAMLASDIPGAVAEREALVRLWEREAILSGNALLLDQEEMDDPNRTRALLDYIERMKGLLIVVSRDPLRLRTRSTMRLDVSKPNAAEQQALWQAALGPMAEKLNGQVETAITHFNLGEQGIRAAGAQVLGDASQVKEEELASLLWEACRTQARSRLDDLAQRIEPVATWDDLVIPEPQCRVLRDIAVHVRQRTKVYGAWGFAAKGSRGLGISALFAGVSGTGKTMAAEVLANELCLDLYRIDLSSVVSKYIGETEKNLRRVFDTAEESGAILLFDEADALFGKRSEVKDSHDRYANIQVGYLLQRMESYRGLAILTTNMKNVLDTAFLRRIRFIVQFQFPDTAQRAEIWRRIFPSDTPTDGLDISKLARLNVAGGNIRNIALNAAFLAADTNEPVRMTHLVRAARSEYAKLEKSMTEL